jgi:hypothetical protein
MRYIIPIIFVAATLLVGCHSPSQIHTQAAAPPPFHPMLITTLGTKTSPDGIWRIGVSESSLDLSRSAAHAGWFVYIESEFRVWAYDGDRSLILQTETPSGPNSGGTTYSGRFPCAVPAEVFSRLPEQKQKEIQTHG